MSNVIIPDNTIEIQKKKKKNPKESLLLNKP